MNLDPKIAEQLGIGLLAVVAGVSGWILPYKWNLLRLRKNFAARVPDSVNRKIPKVAGTLLLLVGLAILIATAILGPFE